MEAIIMKRTVVLMFFLNLVFPLILPVWHSAQADDIMRAADPWHWAVGHAGVPPDPPPPKNISVKQDQYSEPLQTGMSGEKRMAQKASAIIPSKQSKGVLNKHYREIIVFSIRTVLLK